jgi:hypothetical protein
MLWLVDVNRMQKIQGRYMALVIQEAGTTTISACTARAATTSLLTASSTPKKGNLIKGFLFSLPQGEVKCLENSRQDYPHPNRGAL